MSKITIALAEDHEILRKSLKVLIELENDITIIGEAEDGLQAITLSQLDPMIVIMDISLPKINGIEAAQKILESKPAIKILFLSAHTDDRYIERATAIGASGYLFKQCCPQLLIQAVREIAQGNQFFRPHTYSFSEQIEGKLSIRETQVLKLIAEGLSNKEIANRLKISVKTVEKHRQNLMDKLSIHDTASLTRYAISEGILKIEFNA